MDLYIKKIEIKNFRSIQSLSIDTNRLAILVGKNDTGKSNILRALNLFFKGEVMPGIPFNFERDYNILDIPGKNKQARQVLIRLEIFLPDSYTEKNGDYVIWEKTWRTGGLHSNSRIGKRLGVRGGVQRDSIDIDKIRSRANELLDVIEFVYVPAIREGEYFSRLRSDIYSAVAKAAGSKFRRSSTSFENAISNHLKDLTKQISLHLGFQSRLALPKDLGNIFEKLDFLSDGSDISLDERGDGIKVRHIPLILKFIAEKTKDSQFGKPDCHIIWGYEEPENNLEISSCIELADQLSGYLSDGISQMFLTTHSPVIYNLNKGSGVEQRPISCHQIYNESDERGTEATIPTGDIDTRMGATALYAPMLRDFQNKHKREMQIIEDAKKYINFSRKTIFVEGATDQLIYERALRVFAPDAADEIDVVTKEMSAGGNYVLSMLKCWLHYSTHHKDTPRAAGLLDQDGDNKKKIDNWNSRETRAKLAKCFCLGVPEYIIPARQAGFLIPVDLESLYGRETWEWAETQGKLEKRDIDKIMCESLVGRVCRSETTTEDELREEWEIFAKYKFINKFKFPVAKYLVNENNKSDFQYKIQFSCIENLIGEITKYLLDD